ncbi:mannose-1-phosphate guanylyltransferase/mannose-6-phosphate isomerase [Candidatus Gillettellia adelgis]
MLLPVIMAGGTGSRLWPMSRELYPKQFLRLRSFHSMLQETLNRLDGVEISEPVIICNQNHRFIVAEQLRQIGMLSHNIILEPLGRNTAPAIALAALNALAQGKDPIMLVLAADHIIKNIGAFRSAIKTAHPFSAEKSLVTFGIVPTKPETGYGYIQRGEYSANAEITVSCVKRFVEKPDLATAKNYVDSGEYFWNSGMFMFRSKRYLEELKKFRPDIFFACQSALNNTTCDENFINVNQDAFARCPDASIDYAVMEHTQDAVMISLDAGWSDVGSWSALWEVSPKDTAGNALTGDTFLYNVHDCYINTDKTLVAAIGVDNLVIVNTRDALLVVNKSKVQDVKEIVKHLKQENRSEYKRHRDVYQMWGVYKLLISEKRFYVNCIVVNPGKALSLQIQYHRIKHWVVLAGTAAVTSGDRKFLLTKNQSVLVPIGVIHCLENPGNVPLEVIEVQMHSYREHDEIFV